MTFRVIIFPQAQRDIDRNADWWADHHSVEQAVRLSGFKQEVTEETEESPGMR